MSIRKGFPLTTTDMIAPASTDIPLLEVKDLVVHYPVKMPLIQRLFSREKLAVHAIDGISFSLRRGEIFGLVGESGCGKTTAGRAILKLVEPTSGRIKFEGIDITRAKESRIRPLRQKMQIIFQDPHASLNPAMTIGQAIGHPLRIHHLANNAEYIRETVLQAMREVELTPEEQLYDKYPRDLSGGQKQRAVIARAMILLPHLIVADEPVAMLDMSIRAKVLELMLKLREKFNLTYIFITHDLATAKFLCDRIAIMYLGRIVEIGNVHEIFADPKHPYTKALLKAIPIPDPTKRRRKELPRGEVPDAVYPPAGCRFHPRCPAVLASCGWEGRDFIDYMEERRLDANMEKQDLPILGPIEKWWAKGPSAGTRIEGPDPSRVISYIHNILAQSPPQLAAAVQAVTHENRHVIVQFRAPDPLSAKPVNGRLVECLLYG